MSVESLPIFGMNPQSQKQEDPLQAKSGGRITKEG